MSLARWESGEGDEMPSEYIAAKIARDLWVNFGIVVNKEVGIAEVTNYIEFLAGETTRANSIAKKLKGLNG